ncbi:MAG: RRXRR domain-containing protein [Rhabdochlamydiaceae bacterium]|nr:RRXRR domain-containing protein [Rhabdochlamydiaceae bacterium]
MQKTFVLNKNKQPLMPCSAERARQLLSKRKAAVFKLYPFTIILKEREKGDIQKVEVKIDPGSKASGIALVGNFERGKEVLWAANLEHKGQTIKSLLDSRRALRRGRRQRKTRYRAPRFNNRTRKEGWLAPSVQSRVDNICTLVKRLSKLIPLASISVETVRFDMQKIQNPEISGIEYQQGELFGYEIREYLLEKWGRKCAYCLAENTRLEIDHILAKSRGGSDQISNLAICCRDCNVKKSNHTIHEFLKDKPLLSSKILDKAKTPFKDVASVNSTRIAIAQSLAQFNLPLTSSSGGITKFNRVMQGYEKDHWIDAACVGESGSFVHISPLLAPLIIRATGRGCRQFCRMDKYGFPRTSAKKQKSVYGFKTGDLVKATVLKGKNIGTYFGRVAVRHSGNFCIDTPAGKVDGVNHKYCQNLQRSDGYAYLFKQPKEAAIPPRPKGRGILAVNG